MAFVIARPFRYRDSRAEPGRMTAPAETEVKDPGSVTERGIDDVPDRSWRLGFSRPGKCVGDERFFSLDARASRNESASKRGEKRNDRRAERKSALLFLTAAENA